MRLRDVVGMRESGEELTPDVRSELEAIDTALSGEPVAPGMEDLGQLASELREERPDPDPGFGAELDAWAAAGFPPGERPGAQAGRERSSAAFAARLRSVPPRRLLAPAGAAAALILVVAIAISTVEFENGGDGSGDIDGPAVTALEEPASGGGAEAVAPTRDVAPAGGGAQGLAAPGVLRRAQKDASRPGPAAGRERRRVERDAELTLAAPADEVQDVTNEAIRVVSGHRGIVLSSRSTSDDDQARATLELVIPTRNLDAALDELSDLADVKSLSEGALDITRPFIDARDQLRGLRAEIRGTLELIRNATTEEELDRLRARLEDLQRAESQAQAEFENLERRARQSRVILEITSEGASESDWSFDDALDDAGRVLTVAAGVALISAAVLLPLALIAALAYLTISSGRRRARERALDD